MKTADLQGAALDYYVAKAEGVDAVMSDPYRDGSRSMVTFYSRGHDGRLDGRGYKPSSHWEEGGILIDKHRPHLHASLEGWYSALLPLIGPTRGATPLQAICRAVVRAAFGDEVEEVLP